MNPKVSIIFITVFAVAMSRLIPHWPNVTAVAAIAIFGGATLRNSVAAILIPVSAIFLSDLIINNTFYSAYYDGFVLFGNSAGWIYGAFILMTVIAHFGIKAFKVSSILSVTVLSTLLFFFLTNTGSWLSSPLYVQDASGLLLAYEAGLPFLLNSLLGNLFFVGVFFYGYSFVVEKNTQKAIIK